jgi:hypothetical protein
MIIMLFADLLETADALTKGHNEGYSRNTVCWLRAFTKQTVETVCFIRLSPVHRAKCRGVNERYLRE